MSGRLASLARRVLPQRGTGPQMEGGDMPPPDPAAILSALPMATVVLDGQDRFRFVNHAAEQFFQLSAANMVGMELAEFLPC